MRDVLFQLVDQGYLERSEGDRPVLKLTASGEATLNGGREVQLKQPLVSSPGSGVVGDLWTGVDRGLFEHLRALRRTIAEEREVPAYVVFGDATLRELARLRPATKEALRKVKGVGDQKLAELGTRFLEAIAAHMEVGSSSAGTSQSAAEQSTHGPGWSTEPRL